MEKREILRERLYELFQNDTIKKSCIYLSGPDSYQMIKILYNCGVVPIGIVESKVNENKKWGISLLVPENVCASNEAILLTNKSDYEKIKNRLPQTIKVYFDGIPMEKWTEECEVSLEKSLEQILLQGAKLYDSILAKYSEEKNNVIMVYNYTGLGDAYVIGMLYELYAKQNGDKNYIITTMSKACYEVFKMFNAKNVEMVTVEESNALEKLALLCGSNLKIKNLMQSPEYNPYILRKFHGTRFNMFDMYRYYIFDMDNIEGVRREFDHLKNTTNSVKICEEAGVEKGNSVIISPYAKSLVGFDKNVWKQIADKLISSGFKVFTNCADNEIEIEGTARLSFPINEAFGVVEYAGYFVGIRSGFCDVISETNSKKILIYPDYNQFNGLGTYEFCSLAAMGFGKNYIEHKLKFEDGESLAEIVLNEIKS